MSALDAAALAIGSRTVLIQAARVDVNQEHGGEERVRKCFCLVVSKRFFVSS